jgi:3'5'-cyclic nucleotide phosphodiesterase
VSFFRIPEDRLISFLVALESRYSDNPYHNRVHAADVTRSIHCVLDSGMSAYFDEEQQLALYIGAAAHDAEHSGLSNAFLCATNVRRSASRSLTLRPHVGIHEFLVTQWQMGAHLVSMQLIVRCRECRQLIVRDCSRVCRTRSQ